MKSLRVKFPPVDRKLDVLVSTDKINKVEINRGSYDLLNVYDITYDRCPRTLINIGYIQVIFVLYVYVI